MRVQYIVRVYKTKSNENINKQNVKVWVTALGEYNPKIMFL